MLVLRSASENCRGFLGKRFLDQAKVVDWVLGRAWKLNMFLAERVQLIRKARHTKQGVFTHADTKIGEHAWKHNPKGGVVCTHCGQSIKPYLSLADIEVHLRQACQPLQVPLGIRMHHSHDITAIPGHTGQSCRLCRALHSSLLSSSLPSLGPC